MTRSATLDRPATVTITDTKGLTEQFEHVVGFKVGDYLATGTECLTPPAEGEIAYVDGIPVTLDMPLDPFAEIQIAGEPING